MGCLQHQGDNISSIAADASCSALPRPLQHSHTEHEHHLGQLSSPDIVSCRQRLNNEVPSAHIPGAPLFGLLVEGCHIAGLPNRREQGEGCCASTFHTQVLEQTARAI